MWANDGQLFFSFLSLSLSLSSFLFFIPTLIDRLFLRIVRQSRRATAEEKENKKKKKKKKRQ